jgi:hypothetical protein
MNTFNLKSKLALMVTSGLVVGTLAFGALAASPLPALAASGPAATATAAAPDRDGPLAHAFERLNAGLKAQQAHLGKVQQVADKLQDLINKQGGKGGDTSALQAALTAFKAQVVSAEASDRAAGDILSAHAGFDANGKVTDRDAARKTVQSARQALKDANNILKQAATNLRAAMKEWRDAHPRPTPAPSAAPTN